MIAWLHDFERIDINLAAYKKELEAEKDNLLTYNPSNYINMDSLTRQVFFPKLDMTFSQRENPLDIVESLKAKHQVMRRELLLQHQLIEKYKMNDKQV